MAERHEFEQTLDVLEQTRLAKEEEYLEHLRQLGSRVEGLKAAAAAAEGHAEKRRAPSAEPLPNGTCEGEELTAQEPWPTAGGGVRRRLNAALRWALRDYLAVLDRRHRAMAQSLAFEGGVARRRDQETYSLAMQQSLGWAEASVEAVELLREALNRTVESLDLLVGTAERLRLMADAKHAETVQRSVYGPARKMELMFEEFARQQEALLAELVGRRQEIDEIIRQLRQPDAS